MSRATPKASVNGLGRAEVEERRRRGQANLVAETTSRSYWSILRANTVTRFNAIISTLVVVVLAVGELPDALFGLVMVVNAAIGIVQEVRAKRTLDRLTILTAPRASVIRSGEDVEIAVDELVLDDIVVLSTGDQVPADAEVLEADGLELNEALLTGEVDTVEKEAGDEVLSGSFVVAGAGLARLTRVGEHAYAHRLAAEARRFSLTQSELRRGIDRILRLVTWLLIPTSALLLFTQLRAGETVAEGLIATVAGLVGMVPQGLILLTSLALAIAVLRLGRKNVLVQELPAVEVLARVDVVCFDKTGTLTEGRIVFERTESVVATATNAVSPLSEVSSALASIAALEATPNPTVQAIAAALPEAPAWKVVEFVPFSSARKFSAATFADHGTWILGAPEIVLPPGEGTSTQPKLHARAAGLAATGRRVLVLAHSDGVLRDVTLPADRRPVALLTLTEKLRPDAPQTIRYFDDQNVALKVLSGDHPQTVAAISQEVGIPGADEVYDARKLPASESKLAAVVDTKTVFGRVSPEQKQAMLRALRGRGHVVAMTGDGVNDILALKDADIGIAMGSGSAATRAVAQLVLIDGRFATLPDVVVEGRRIIANIERVAALFLTKTVYATLLALAVGVVELPFPFLPRHLTLVGAVTIGIPAFFLSFERTLERARAGFLDRVLRFSVPSGVIAAVVTFAAYELARSSLVDASLEETRTAATIVLGSIALWILTTLARPLTRVRVVLIAAMVVLFALAFLTPFASDFFSLDPRGGRLAVVIAVAVLLAVAAIEGWQRIERFTGGR